MTNDDDYLERSTGWIWRRMIERCHEPWHPSYPNYGARGITVCDRWFVSCAAFKADVGLRPSLGHSIDRIDVNRGYEPGNVRWATAKEQSRNKRNTIYVLYLGKKLPLAELCERHGMSLGNASAKCRRRGGLIVNGIWAKLVDRVS